MQELLRNAWEGWLNFTDAGKIVALLLAVLLFLWFGMKYREQHTVIVYTTIITVLCICPITAAVLMVYQTRFYDYQWIWTLVPTTMVIAYGGTVFLRELLKDTTKTRLQKGFVLLGLLAAVALCGRLGNEQWKVDGMLARKEPVEQLFAEVTQQTGDNEICLWAPQEVIEFSRMLQGDICLLYGRNMWDQSLNAYAYDVYSPEVMDCYLWMTYVEETGEFNGEVKLVDEKRALQGSVCVETAIRAGVNVIVLPKSIKEEALLQLEDLLAVQVKEQKDYYYIVLS